MISISCTVNGCFAVIATSCGAIVILIVSIVAAIAIVIVLQGRVVSVDQKEKTAHVSKGKIQLLATYCNNVSLLTNRDGYSKNFTS